MLPRKASPHQLFSKIAVRYASYIRGGGEEMTLESYISQNYTHGSTFDILDLFLSRLKKATLVSLSMLS